MFGFMEAIGFLIIPIIGALQAKGTAKMRLRFWQFPLINLDKA